MDPWAELVVLAELEHELVQSGRWDELAAVSTERLRRSHALGQPPESARPSLERLAQLQAQIRASLASAHAFASRELGEIRRGRTAVRGYGASLAPTPSRVDSLR